MPWAAPVTMILSWDSCMAVPISRRQSQVPPALHERLWQSVGDEHGSPAQPPQVLVPPQSTPASFPFFTRSMQLGTWHTPLVHTPLWQSLALEQCNVSAHFAHVAPPQSVSVSVPFLTLSLQAGAWQTPVVHTPLVQSAAMPQVLPVPHVWLWPSQVAPPQSRSVSRPSFAPSVHVGVWQLGPQVVVFGGSQSSCVPCTVPSPQNSGGSAEIEQVWQARQGFRHGYPHSVLLFVAPESSHVSWPLSMMPSPHVGTCGTIVWQVVLHRFAHDML